MNWLNRKEESPHEELDPILMFILMTFIFLLYGIGLVWLVGYIFPNG